MNLWFRLLWLLVTAGFRSTLALPAETSILRFRVGVFDLDTSFHMNNGRYLTLMDLGRLDLMFRSGLWRSVLKNKWVPIASSIMIRYRRELAFTDRFTLRTKILCWDEKSVVMEQVFVIDSGPRKGQVAAQGLFKGGLYDRKAKSFVPVQQIMAAIGVSVKSPEIPKYVSSFLTADMDIKSGLSVAESDFRSSS